MGIGCELGNVFNVDSFAMSRFRGPENDALESSAPGNCRLDAS